MKAKYFPNTDFLNATLGENPSYMWRSILAAKDVIKQGCRKNIGTEADTNVWNIPRLPCNDNGYLTTVMQPELANIKVCDLMDTQEKKWDDAILMDLFNEKDVQLIQNIPLSSRRTNDTWMWLFDGNGEFTVRSCYRKLVGECSTTYPTFWKKIWRLELLGKIRFFLWRTCRFCLPTNPALIEKRVNVPNTCSWCRVETENAKHILFECQFAKEVWESTGLAQWSQTIPGELIMEHFRRLLTNGTKEQCVLAASLCWSLWNRRNTWVWNRIASSVFRTTSAVTSLLVSWRMAQLKQNRSTSATMRSSIQRWQPPQPYWVKINIDAAMFTDLNSIGVGGVIRDEMGHFVKAMCKQKQGTWSPREAEALSFREVLSWVKDYGFTRCIFETDSKLLADACNGSPGRSYFHSIVGDCVESVKHFEDVLERFVPRSTNEVAHLLARVSRSMSGFKEWDSVAPNFLSDVLSSDLI